jgi:hypothetical protein
MKPDTPVYRVMHLLPPGRWLFVILVSMVLAAGSSLVLLASFNAPAGYWTGRVFDAAELFLRDTVRLSFKDKIPEESNNSVFVAPQGILEKDAAFKWLAELADVPPPADAASAPAAAPAAILDPNWVPAAAEVPKARKKP